ncbi:hypothetical protein SAMN05421678_1125 [Actinopolymorpha cephalotaxi]|uniref:HTH merR-type domain-containing protein n=1 Tax=Actinopolymorpha cephalotaxi TaxID=504797 RepID=A0A1I2X538_9ACTN|nr:hypothetical protein SAMN05421678_1125 [Actinopolymorpha cephalotaxi]
MMVPWTDPCFSRSASSRGERASRSEPFGSTPTTACHSGRACPAGYRRYSADALARLTLVRTLCDLGIDLVRLREVAEAHADAVAVQIRILRLRHAVLTALAR